MDSEKQEIANMTVTAQIGAEAAVAAVARLKRISLTGDVNAGKSLAKWGGPEVGS